MTQPTPWRMACELTLRRFSDADSIRFWGIGHEVEGAYQPIFNYRFEHTYAAVLLARWLAPATGADLDVVECAAWLHDVAKRLKDLQGKDTHAQDASAKVEDILAGTDFPSSKIAAVRHAIEHHVGLKLTKRLEPLETACLWDCDKLSKIGAASLIHFGCISGAFQPISTGEILKRGEAWLDLARTITACFNTEPAREEGRRRLAFIEAHYAQLRREWSDPMEMTPP
ncbi:MAG: HD domain-containing protein [Acidobacteria bacterium]|nr:HD domain-containing protein [Acidobacteriota bacterium]MBI3489465.1 HD domain-containing protein [Acidobacteriota bacterium]